MKHDAAIKNITVEFHNWFRKNPKAVIVLKWFLSFFPKKDQRVNMRYVYMYMI